MVIHAKQCYPIWNISYVKGATGTVTMTTENIKTLQ